MSTCIDCGRAPAAAGRRVCNGCLEAFIADRMRRLGWPPGGRDPDEVLYELRIGRGAALLLHGRLTGDRDDERAGMTAVLADCHARPGLTPAAALVGPLLNLVSSYVVDGYLGGELVTAWRAQFVDRLSEAGAIAAAEAELVDDAELVRDCRATEAAAAVMAGRLTGDRNLEADGWRRVEALAAEHHATPTGLLLGPVLGLVNDHVRDGARDRLVDGLREVIMTWSSAPDTPEGLT